MSGDNFDEFMRSYIHNVRKVSRKTMLELMKIVEDDLLEADICWMVTDNIRELLSKKHLTTFDSSKDNYIEDFISNELSDGNLLIIVQDYNINDHWFAVVGSGEYAHIIEHTQEVCNFHETFTIKEMAEKLADIQEGIIPDRFYGVKGSHIFTIESYSRKPITKETVLKYIE